MTVTHRFLVWILDAAMASYSRSLTPSRQTPGMDGVAIARAQQQHRANVMHQQQHLRAPPAVQPGTCPMAILWDIENCPVPGEVNAEDVAGNIRIALREHPHVGAVTMFSAYGDFNHFPRKVREGCQRTGVNLIDVPNGKKDAADKAILVDMFLFALDNPPPSTIFLITGDVDFAPALHKLGQRGYVVVLVIPDGVGVSSALRGAGRFVYDWPCLCRGALRDPPRQGRGMGMGMNNLYPVDDRNAGRVPNNMYAVEDRIPVSQFQDPVYPDQYNMGWTVEESDPRNDEDVYGEEILAWGQRQNMYSVPPVDYGHQQYVLPGQVQPQAPRMSSGHNGYFSSQPAQSGHLRNQASGGFVSRSEGTPIMSNPVHPGMQAAESDEPTSPGGSSPLWVQPGDLLGLKRQLVQLLNQQAGKMMLSKVPAEYNKLFGRPLYLAEYNAQRLVHLIDKMKDTLVIKGDGTSKMLHLAKKDQGRATNKYKPSGNRASAPKSDKDKDTSEDSEPEGTIPSNKELEKESPKIDFASDLSKSSLLVVEKDTEKETFAAVDSVNKRHLLDMDMEEETILVQTSLSSDVDRAPVIIKNNLENVPKVEVVLDVEEEDIKVEDFSGDVTTTNLANLSSFKRQLQELLVVYSFRIPLKDFVKFYQQRYARVLDLSSFGVDSLDALLGKVNDVAVVKEIMDTTTGLMSYYLTAV